VRASRACILLLLIASITDANTIARAAEPCAADAFRQFDFWVGTWTVVDQNGRAAGRNVITLEQQSCVLIERWTSAKGGTGMSMNHYDPLSGRWKQHWVSPGAILEMSGGMTNGSMVLEGPLQYLADSRVTLLRGTWTLLSDGRVRQHFVESTDNGKTWSEWFDCYYSRETDSR
jgi:hypothetical protein